MPTSPFAFSFGRRTGAPLAVATGTGEEVQITPESLVLLVHGRRWGYVWNWPLAVSVACAGRGGQVERKAVVDATRLALWVLGLITALLSVSLLARSRRT